MIFPPATVAAALPGACSLSDSAGVSCGEPARHSVGAVRHDTFGAEDAGQIETAKDYTRRCLAASRSRTPEHKDRLAREHLAAVEASLDGGVDFFQAQGRMDAA